MAIVTFLNSNREITDCNISIRSLSVQIAFQHQQIQIDGGFEFDRKMENDQCNIRKMICINNEKAHAS